MSLQSEQREVERTEFEGLRERVVQLEADLALTVMAPGAVRDALGLRNLRQVRAVGEMCGVANADTRGVPRWILEPMARVIAHSPRILDMPARAAKGTAPLQRQEREIKKRGMS